MAANLNVKATYIGLRHNVALKTKMCTQNMDNHNLAAVVLALLWNMICDSGM